MDIQQSINITATAVGSWLATANWPSVFVPMLLTILAIALVWSPVGETLAQGWVAHWLAAQNHHPLSPPTPPSPPKPPSPPPRLLPDPFISELLAKRLPWVRTPSPVPSPPHPTENQDQSAEPRWNGFLSLHGRKRTNVLRSLTRREDSLPGRLAPLSQIGIGLPNPSTSEPQLVWSFAAGEQTER